MVPLLGFPADHRQDIGIILVDSQKLFIIFNVLREMLLEEQIVEKAALYDGHDRLQLFPDQQIVAALVPLPVNLIHSFPQRRNNPGLFHRFGDVFQHAKLNGFLGIIKLVIGAHHNKDHVPVRLPDLPHGLDSVDAGHLDVHNGDIRAEILRELNHASSRLGKLDAAQLAKLLLYDKFQRINHDSLIVRKHDLITAHLSSHSEAPQDASPLLPGA